MNFGFGVLIGLLIGFIFWYQERENRKIIEKYRAEDNKDKDFWHDYATKKEEEIEQLNKIICKCNIVK